MSLTCRIIGHLFKDIDPCYCQRCNEYIHRCGSGIHCWTGCVCRFCKTIREQDHVLHGCACTTSHKNVHLFQNNICFRCGLDSSSITTLVPKLGYIWRWYDYGSSCAGGTDYGPLPGWRDGQPREIDEVSRRIDTEVFTAMPALKESIVCIGDKIICRVKRYGDSFLLEWDFDDVPAESRKNCMIRDSHRNNINIYQFPCKGDETITCRFEVEDEEKILIQSAERLRKEAKWKLSQIYGCDTEDQD